ncbi:mucin-4-like isoform X44 [Anopheles funestus]|uniref:mucin-4-like isoform X44 n=1 Tax=Anopheles funestus TaxID=62324 RepID=UPI0020C700D2|nr:mucin-4-like isoform X44 [Anopheles funestus]
MFSLRGAHIYVFPNGNNEKRMKIEVNSNRVTIGAHPLNNIRLHTLNAERLHCKIFADSSNSVTIENYSQKNPIFVNGVCVERRAKLHDNDRFEVAGSAFLWNFDPSHIRVVSKPKKRPNLHSRRKTITLKRIRSTGDITKQSMIKVPRAVGLMLDEYRKRRTIHSTMSAQSLNNIGRNVKNCEEIDLTNQTNAHAESSTQAALDITSSDLSSCITPVIEKENILHSHIKEQKTKLTAQISATKRRHLACHTPVSNLIDLTTPPAKSRITPVVRKPISAKAVQSPRLLDVINIVTPSPNKKGRSTPNSLRAAVATPKRTLLKSAIKNSRANESVGANNTPIPSQSTKKTPNVKLNTLRTNTPKVTPASSKSSSIKIRKHLISTLNEKKGDVLLKPDSPIAIINTGRFSKHSTPTVGKGDRTPKRGNLCVTPKAQRVVQNVIDDHNNEVTNATIEKSAGESCASVLPIIDVQSIIRKPNRTTQIRSARYSDITPHESFADGLLPLATPAEEKEFLLETESTPLPAYMFQDELKSINNMHTNFNPNRNSCSSIVATVSTESSNIRKTMSDFSSSLSGSPLRRFSHKLMQTNIQPDNDWKKDENTNEFESDIDTLAKDADEHGMLASNDLEPPVQKDMVSTPELRHSWRHTRKCIGSAFTSLNTSRPQLDLTAEIDESLVVIEDEEPAPEQKELYNMECSEAFSTTNEQYDLQCPTVKNRATVHMENVPNVSTGPTFESTPDILCSSALEERSAEPSACNTVESTEFPVEHVIEDALEAEDHSAEELLHVDSSEVQSSNILEKGEEMMELMEVMSEAATEQVLDSTSDIFSASALEERSAEPSACSTVESTELPVEHVIEDAPEAEDHSAEELLHVDSSEVQTSNILEKGKEMMEPMEVMSEAATEEVLDSASDVLSASALEERSAEPSACSTVESTELPVKHVIEDAPEAEDHSAEELLHVDSSEVQTSNILEKGKEMMEPMEVMSEAATEEVLDSASDVLSASALEERSAEPSACSTVESTEFPVEHVIEDAPEAEDHSAEELLHVDSSEVQTSNILEKGKEMMEPMEVMSEAVTEEVLDSASDVLSASALEERSAEPSACSTVESTEFPVEHVIEDAPEAEDHSAEELLHVDSSEVQSSNILEKGKEMMEPMEVMTEAATEEVLDSTSDVLSVSALEEGSAEPSACSTVESTEFPVEHVIEDAPEAEDHSAEELLHVDSSEVQTSNILEKGKEMMEPMEVMCEAATEQVLDSASDVLSVSALEEGSAEPSACSTVESTEFPVEHVIEDAPEAEDHSAEELLHVDSSEVQTSNILEKGKEMMEPMEVMCEAATEQVLDSASDIISASTLEKSGQYPFCHDKDENLHENVGRTGMTESTPKISQRRLYTKKNYSSVTPDNKMNKETPLFISDFDYLGMSETPKSKAKKTNIKTVDCSSIETRKQLPKRVCRGKIHNLSEDFLAGDSPAPKFVKSKVLTEDDQHESNTVTVTDGSSFTDQHFPKQQSKASATRSGRSRKNVLVPVTSNSSGTMEVTDTEPDKILIENNTPVRRGRTRKQVLVSNEDSNKEMDESIKVNENYPSVQTRKTALEGESVSHLGPIDQATGKYVEEKNTSVRRGRPRKQVLVANDMSTKSKDNSVLHSEQIEPLETENNINENETPVRAGRTRKKVLVAEIAKVSKAVEVIDTEQVLHQNVGTKVDKTDTKSEQTEVVVTENQRKVPADKPAAVRRARPRKNAPKTESSILIHPDVTIAKNVTPDEPHPTEDKLDEKTGPVGHPSTDQNLEEKDAPPAVRRGRAHKKVPEVDVTTVVQPVKKGRGKKVIETVEEPIAITENVTPDERHPTEDKLDEKTGPVGHPSTDKNLQEKDAPPAVRRGRAQKKVPEVDVSTVVQPVKKGRGKRVTETVEEPIPITENVTPDERRPTEDKLDDKTGTVGHLSIDKNLEEKDAPPAVRRGRAHKKVPEVDVSTVVQPVKKGRGKKITEMVEESIAITENVTPDERHPTEDKLDEKTGSVGHPSAEKNLEEEDAPPAVRRGRAHKKVPEVDVTTVVQPVKKGRGKKVTETVEEPIAITENVTPDERHPTEDKLDDKTGPVGHPSSDKNLEEKHAPPAVRRGRAHKKVSEVDVSTVVQPVKKGRGKKVTEMAEEKEQDIVTPRKTGRKRKINMQIDPQESEENQKIEDTNEIQPESNRSGGVAQEEDSEKTTEYPNEKKTKKSAAPQAKSKSRKTVKKGDESVSANTSAVKNEAESIDTNVPRRTRAKRN